jgi:plastocyanin
MQIRTRTILSAAVLVLGGVACSSKGASSPQKTASVDLKALAFAPSQVHIAVGGTVTWTDREPVEHTITSGKPNALEKAFDHVLHEGETFTFTFAEADDYPFFCKRHPTNMQGTVEVS